MEGKSKKEITLPLRDIARLIVKDQGIKSGHWGVSVRFGLSAANVQTRDGETGGPKLAPAAIIPVVEIGITEFPTPNNLTVDASEFKKRTAKPKTKKQQPTKKKGRRRT